MAIVSIYRMLARTLLPAFAALAIADVCHAQSVAPTSSSDSTAKAQEALVWSGYYDGPIDGNAGQGTQSAIKRFQHDLGKAENGTLDDAESAALFERAQKAIQITGFKQSLDARTGIRVGLPLTITARKRTVSTGTDYLAADGRVQIGLRVLQTDQDIGSIFARLKQSLSSSSQLSYSTSRSNWFVLAGENSAKKYYMRYYSNHDLISGFVSVIDKTLSKEETAPLSAAITVMSLTMQPFAAETNRASVSKLTAIDVLEPDLGPASSSETVSDQPSPVLKSAPASTAAPDNPARNAANDSVVQDLQKKISDMEAAQRKLKQELANKTEPPPAAPSRPVPPEPKNELVSYQVLIGAFAAVLVIMFLARRRSPAPQAPSTTPGSEAAPLAPSIAPAPAVALPDEVPSATVNPPAAASPVLLTTSVAQGGDRGGGGVVIVIGGMAVVVFLVAFIVQQISAFVGL